MAYHKDAVNSKRKSVTIDEGTEKNVCDSLDKIIFNASNA